MRLAFLPILCLVLACTGGQIRASAEISLPLEGYYRPGRYMPVHITADLPARDTPLLLQGQGVIPTQINTPPARLDVIVPLLPLDNTLRSLCYSTGQTQSPLRALQPSQRLVGLVADDLNIAQQLFPNHTVIPLRLDPATPLPGPIAAWQTLDAIVLDQPLAQQLGPSTLATLLAGGTRLVVRSPAPPDSVWPWSRLNDCWVLTPDLAGPVLAGPNPSALAPVQGWRAEWPSAFRYRIVLFAAIGAILLLSLTMVRWRFTPLLVLLLSAAIVLLLASWSKNRAAVLLRSGQVVVLRNALAQTDLWHYYASPNATTVQVPWLELTWPFFDDRADRDAMQVSLLCQPDGQPLSFVCRLPPSLKIGFLSRSLSQVSLPAASAATPANPLLRLSQRAYLRPGDQVLGQLPPAPSTADPTST
ncbi:MAG TPA: hypothetical protein VHP11_17080, partial [Tepidisphaeraceae bacterium]|nr:hypothetical protein [Tepidisphaeraceae bacterium]